jgi:hypothetical protein
VRSGTLVRAEKRAFERAEKSGFTAECDGHARVTRTALGALL